MPRGTYPEGGSNGGRIRRRGGHGSVPTLTTPVGRSAQTRSGSRCYAYFEPSLAVLARHQALVAAQASALVRLERLVASVEGRDPISSPLEPVGLTKIIWSSPAASGASWPSVREG